MTVWVLREWRRKNYFPEPHDRDGRLWFMSHQVQLLRRVEQFFRAAWRKSERRDTGRVGGVGGFDLCELALMSNPREWDVALIKGKWETSR